MGCRSTEVRLLAVLAVGVAGVFGSEVTVTDRILPLIQDGGGYSTAITIVNLETTASTFEILFLSRTGAYWEIPVSGPAGVVSDGSYVRGALPAGRSVTFRTNGTAAEPSVGHATVFSAENARLGVTAVVTKRGAAAGLTVPVSPEREDRLVLPFDNTNGATTSLLWVSDTPYTMVTYRAISEEGQELMNGSFQFSVSDNLVQDLFSVADRMPAAQGVRGIIELQIDYPDAGIYDELYFTGLAIQTDVNGASVAMRSMSTGTWRASRH
jgi:hypothetical protein